MRMQALVAKLRQQHQNLLDLQQQEQAWAQLPNSTTIEKLKVGNLTKEVSAWRGGGTGQGVRLPNIQPWPVLTHHASQNVACVGNSSTVIFVPLLTLPLMIRLFTAAGCQSSRLPACFDRIHCQMLCHAQTAT